jgi:hypothetical protein
MVARQNEPITSHLSRSISQPMQATHSVMCYLTPIIRSHSLRCWLISSVFVAGPVFQAISTHCCVRVWKVSIELIWVPTWDGHNNGSRRPGAGLTATENGSLLV